MAKGNMLLGQARGKVGSLVFSRSNGQQITRSHAASVKNPRTTTQMIQRIMLNTVAQAYSRMSEITDHSFEGVQAGQKTMSLFMRKNLNALRARVAAVVENQGDIDGIYAFAPIGNNDFAANDFIVSAGTLPGFDVSFVGSVQAKVVLGGATYGDIIAANNLQRGDQLTFISIKGTPESGVSFHYSRIILDPTNDDGTQADIATPLIAEGKVNKPSPRNTGEFAELALANGELTFNLGTAAAIMQAAAVIVSRKSNDGTWRRSNTQMRVNNGAVAGFVYSLGDCVRMFAQGSINGESDLYLNNAGQGAVVSGGAESFLATTKAGTQVLLTGLSQNSVDGQQYMVAQGSGETHYYIENVNEENKYCGKFLKNGQVFGNQGAWATKPQTTVVPDTNIVTLGAPESEFMKWLQKKGVGLQIWMDTID